MLLVARSTQSNMSLSLTRPFPRRCHAPPHPTAGTTTYTTTTTAVTTPAAAILTPSPSHSRHHLHHGCHIHSLHPTTATTVHSTLTTATTYNTTAATRHSQGCVWFVCHQERVRLV
nr:hypothetical protein [Tanacetum cinerariifolium]